MRSTSFEYYEPYPTIDSQPTKLPQNDPPPHLQGEATYMKRKVIHLEFKEKEENWSFEFRISRNGTLEEFNLQEQY